MMRMTHCLFVTLALLLLQGTFLFGGELRFSRYYDDRMVLQRGKPVLVDLSKVEYIDSSGIASLVESLQTARKKGSNLLLVSVSESALRVLKLARLDRVFTICDDLEDGITKAG